MSEEVECGGDVPAWKLGGVALSVELEGGSDDLLRGGVGERVLESNVKSGPEGLLHGEEEGEVRAIAGCFE